MTPAFRRALASALARDLAITVANSNVLEDQLGKRAIKDLARAKSLDAMGSFLNPAQEVRGQTPVIALVLGTLTNAKSTPTNPLYEYGGTIPQTVFSGRF